MTADGSNCNQSRLQQQTLQYLCHEETAQWFGLAASQAAGSHSSFRELRWRVNWIWISTRVMMTGIE